MRMRSLFNMNYLNHPAADAFPMMDAKRLDELKSDILANGQKMPIVLFEGLILDGRNRMKACVELGIDPRTEVFTGDPWSFVWSLNGARRDLVAEQRYLIWKFCHENSEAFQAEKKRIAEEANAKRSEAAKVQHEVSKPYAGENMPEMVWEQTVPAPSSDAPRRSAKAKRATRTPGQLHAGISLQMSDRTWLKRCALER